MSDEKKYNGFFLSMKGGKEEASEKKGRKTNYLRLQVVCKCGSEKKVIAAWAVPVPLIMSQYGSFQKLKLLWGKKNFTMI